MNDAGYGARRRARPPRRDPSGPVGGGTVRVPSGSEAAISGLERRLAEYIRRVERLDMAEYIELVRSPRRMFVLGLVSGVGRGVGVAVGFVLLGAIALFLLRRLVMLNLPHIGGFIAELVRLVQVRLESP